MSVKSYAKLESRGRERNPNDSQIIDQIARRVARHVLLISSEFELPLSGLAVLGRFLHHCEGLSITSRMPLSREVVGSTVRDFCMLERNFLSHFKLVLLLMLLLSSALLEIRLPSPSGSDGGSLGKASLPLAIIQLLAAFTTIAAAVWEYHSGVKDLLRVRAFFAVTR